MNSNTGNATGSVLGGETITIKGSGFLPDCSIGPDGTPNTTYNAMYVSADGEYYCSISTGYLVFAGAQYIDADLAYPAGTGNTVTSMEIRSAFTDCDTTKGNGGNGASGDTAGNTFRFYVNFSTSNSGTIILGIGDNSSAGRACDTNIHTMMVTYSPTTSTGRRYFDGVQVGSDISTSRPVSGNMKVVIGSTISGRVVSTNYARQNLYYFRLIRDNIDRFYGYPAFDIWTGATGLFDTLEWNQGINFYTSDTATPFTPVTPYTPLTVTLGGVACNDVAIVDDETIVCETPAHAAGFVDVSITTTYDGTERTVIAEDGYKYVPDSVSFAINQCSSNAHGQVDSLIIFPDSFNQEVSNCIIATATTLNPTGYNLSIGMKDAAENSLVCMIDGVENKITAVDDSSNPTVGVALANNTWGYNIAASTIMPPTTWLSVPSSPAVVKNTNTAAPSGYNTVMWFGTKVGYDSAVCNSDSGPTSDKSYSGVVVLTVIGNL